VLGVDAIPEGRLHIERINAVALEGVANRSPEQLIGLLRDNATPHGLGVGFDGRVALTDNMIHQQDNRRPLGLPRVIPAGRLGVALDFVRYAPTIRGAWRTRGADSSPPISPGRTAGDR
jgi:hypothetical protein